VTIHMGNGLAKKILFIEDESALQRALVGVMAERGIKILSALDGEAGLKAAQAEQPDLILLDLVLPKKDGFGVLKELRANAATAKIPVIILSNLEGSVDVMRAMEFGATTYLVKSNYNLDEVVEKVERLLY